MDLPVMAVTFDGDETLWDLQGAIGVALDLAAEVFEREGLTRGGRPVTAVWLASVREEVARRPEFRRRPMEEIRMRAFEECAAAADAPDGFASAVYDVFMEARHAGVRLYGDSERCLRALRERGLRLGLVTNGNSRAAGMGVDGLFDVIVVAAECGLHKPDPEIYRHAARRLGLAPHACVHVGDHPVEDVRASSEAGMRAVWLDRSEAGGECPDAWRTVPGLAGLPDLVRGKQR